MKPTHFFVTTALLLCTGTVTAQGSTASAEVLQSCLLGTRDDTWTKLKLTPDQLRRVQAVQEACKEECDAAGMKKDPNSISNADGNTIMSELDNILSKEQFDGWVAYCMGAKALAPASK